MKWLRAVVDTIVAIYMASWCVVAWIETSALHQPKSSADVYRYPHEIKGVIRYFTLLHDEIHSIAKSIMFAALAIGFVMGFFGLWLDRRIKERSIRQALERNTKSEPQQ